MYSDLIVISWVFSMDKEKLAQPELPGSLSAFSSPPEPQVLAF